MEEQKNPLANPLAQQNSTTAIAQSRAAQEVQAAMVVAQSRPRDPDLAYNKLMKACRRNALAECAVYRYPRGGTDVTGPSIRLAEAAAQAWGNIDSGIIELEQRHGESEMMAYAWDLETNTRVTKVFTVKHERHKKGGEITHLTDPRDIYEMTANQGSRRLRACILGIIPGDIIDAAVAECEKTMQGQSDEPIEDRCRKMVDAFSKYSVTKDMLEARLGHKLSAITEFQLADLKKIYISMKDGMSKREEWFEVVAADVTAAPLTEGKKKTTRKKPAATKSEPVKDNTPGSDELFQRLSLHVDAAIENADMEVDKTSRARVMRYIVGDDDVSGALHAASEAQFEQWILKARDLKQDPTRVEAEVSGLFG